MLYLHYLRVAFELHGEPLAESLRVTKRRTGLSNGTILTARAELVTAGWVTVQEQGEGEAVIVTLVERWEENCRMHTQQGGQKLTTPGQKLTASGQKPANIGRKLTTPHLKNEPFKIEDLKTPFGGVGDGVDSDARATSLEPQLPGMLTEVPPSRPLTATPAHTAEELLEGLYRDGLKSKPARDARELESARNLAADGVTPADAAAWARQAVTEGHIKIVTAATFLKALPGWRARRRQESVPVHSVGYEHDPWHGRRPPIDEADLARGFAL